MKKGGNNQIGILVFFLLTATCFGQNYSWLTAPSNSEVMGDHDFRKYLYVEGNVMEISEKTTYENKISGEHSNHTVTCEFNRSGKIVRWGKLFQNNILITNSFLYSKEGSFSRLIRSYDDGLSARMDFRVDTLFQNPYTFDVPDSAIYNDQKELEYSAFGSMEIYSFYDEKGRRIKDSIPTSKDISHHTIDYKYSKKKISKTIFYPNEDLLIEEIFWLDEYGNWTKCLVKSNGKVKNATITRSIVYFD